MEIKNKWKCFAIRSILSARDGNDAEDVALFNRIQETDDEDLEALFNQDNIIVWCRFEHLSREEIAEEIISLARDLQAIDNLPDSEYPPQRPPVANCDYQVASEDLKDCIFSNLFGDEHLRLQGKSILVGVTRAGNGVLVMKGCFTRKAFKLAHEEAIASGMTIRRWLVYADLCTYSGPSIEFTKLEDVEIEKPQA